MAARIIIIHEKAENSFRKKAAWYYIHRGTDLSFLSRKTSGIPMKHLHKCLPSSFRDFVAQYYSAQYWGTGATPIINTDVLLF